MTRAAGSSVIRPEEGKPLGPESARGGPNDVLNNDQPDPDVAPRVREMVRCHRREIAAGWDIVIHPKSNAAKAEFATLTAELLRLMPTN